MCGYTIVNFNFLKKVDHFIPTITDMVFLKLCSLTQCGNKSSVFRWFAVLIILPLHEKRSRSIITLYFGLENMENLYWPCKLPKMVPLLMQYRFLPFYKKITAGLLPSSEKIPTPPFPVVTCFVDLSPKLIFE